MEATPGPPTELIELSSNALVADDRPSTLPSYRLGPRPVKRTLSLKGERDPSSRDFPTGNGESFGFEIVVYAYDKILNTSATARDQPAISKALTAKNGLEKPTSMPAVEGRRPPDDHLALLNLNVSGWTAHASRELYRSNQEDMALRALRRSVASPAASAGVS